MPDAVPEAQPPASSDQADAVAVRAANHHAIDRLTEAVVPALAAKLAATGLAEIEIRDQGWKVRLRRPPGPAPAPAAAGRRAVDRPSRAQPGHEGHGHAPGALEGHRSARPSHPAPSTNGSSPAPSVDGHAADTDAARRRDRHRAVVTSPAVGVFQPRAEIRPGTRVRSGDPLGVVDMLGVPQEVVAAADAVVGQLLVEAGDAVEYGQELAVLELATPHQSPSAGG